MPGTQRTFKRIEQPGHARLLTFSCYRRLNLLGHPGIRDAFVKQMMACQLKFHFKMFGWFVMPNHVHLLLMPDTGCTVQTILRSIKGPLAKQALSRWRQMQAAVLNKITDQRGQTHFWQAGGGYDRNIFEPLAFFNKLEYIHENPVKAQIVNRSVD